MRTPAVVAALLLTVLANGDGSLRAQGPRHGPRWECSLDDVASSTACAEPATFGEARYITDIVMQSSDSAAREVRIVAGALVAGFEPCEVDELDILGQQRFAAAANDQPPTVITFETPLRVPPGLALCYETGDPSTVHMLGYLAY